jgi:hypothetical protein
LDKWHSSVQANAACCLQHAGHRQSQGQGINVSPKAKSAIGFAILVALGWVFFWTSLGDRFRSLVLLASFSYLLAWVMALVIFYWAMARSRDSWWLKVPFIGMVHTAGLPPRPWLAITVAPASVVLLVALAR